MCLSSRALSILGNTNSCFVLTLLYVDIGKDSPSTSPSGGDSAAGAGPSSSKSSKIDIVVGAVAGSVCAAFVYGLLLFCFISKSSKN